MEIRVMTIDDYDAVLALWRSCEGMGLNNLDDSRQGIGRFLSRNPSTCLVAVQEQRLAGVIMAGHDGRRGYIYHTAVAEDCRRMGVGSRLVEACLTALRAEGIHKAALVAFADNEAGNAFWARQGFTPRGDLTYRNRLLNDAMRSERS